MRCLPSANNRAMRLFFEVYMILQLLLCICQLSEEQAQGVFKVRWGYMSVVDYQESRYPAESLAG